MSAAPAIAPSVTAHPLGDELILFASQQKRLYALNRTAAWVWNQWAAGGSLQKIQFELQRLAGDEVDVANDLIQLVLSWERAGLLIDTSSGKSTSTLPVPAEEPPISAPARKAKHPFATFQLLDLLFRIESDEPQALSLCTQLLAHLRVDDVAAQKPIPTFTVKSGGSGLPWRVRISRGWQTVDEPDELGPLIHGQSMLQAYLHSSPFAGFHAAAVARGEHCVLFPGDSGSGKSTLTAALVARGYEYCTDELALLTAPSMKLRPCPVNIGLKRGSWKALRKSLPTLKQLPTWRRADQQLIKYYLPPGFSQQNTNDLKTVRAIICPEYAHKTGDELTRVSPGTALQALTNSGYHQFPTLDDDWLKTVLDWLEPMPCFRLRYSSMDFAFRCLDQIL